MLVGERGGDHPMEPHIAVMKALQRHEPKAAPNRRAGNAPRSTRSFGDGNALSVPLPLAIPQATLPKKRYPLSMSNTRVDFRAPAMLRKWPSLSNERVSPSLGARPYMIIDGTLDECIRKFLLRPKSQRHLYEIHTVPQPDVVSAILSADHIVELARLRDFLEK